MGVGVVTGVTTSGWLVESAGELEADCPVVVDALFAVCCAVGEALDFADVVVRLDALAAGFELVADNTLG